ncbi:hypothetical protein [Clostridium beijerinckii]|uniref:Uncharacterized protein n=1 Tax=Clostridium beijerinckii TaxID=1520 RepID=A0AAE5LN39_CLOBE|nr:hypothetical protein [Clostridium beijerinckii]NSB12095.1 hypothetical protein [Clostridium beijerinckii]OOM27429.1 hypothetical protein CLOBE_29870 [Clostridium beijerinckii]
MIKEIDKLIIELLIIKNQILAESPQEETIECGWTEEEFDIVAKAYAEAEKDYKFVA